MHYSRMPIEAESPEELGYGSIRNNLSESSVADLRLAALDLQWPDLALLYGEHRGSGDARASLAAEYPGIAPADILLTGGAAGALFIVSTALLGPQDHLVVVKPNYATNLETPRALGCAVTHVDLRFEDGFRTDVDRLAAAVTPQTRLISITTPHNPTGVSCSEAELRAIAELARRRNCILLVDETYRDLCFGAMPPLAATLGEHVVSVSSLSKAYGAPGIRLGWLITRNTALQELFLAAKEQISICGSVLDEWVGEQILHRRGALLQATMAEMRVRRQLVVDWMAGEPLLEWVAPDGGVVCFPRMRQEPAGGTAAFYDRLLKQYGTYVGPGHWFEMSDRHFRLGYGWSTREELADGLQSISAALRA